LRAGRAAVLSRMAAGRAKPLAACQGKTIPGAVLLVAAGEVYPVGCRGPGGSGRAAPDPG
jgi:hypothetical protein